MRLLCLFILSMFLCSFNARASEAINIDKLYTLLENSYPYNINYKKISLLATGAINSFDKNFRVYNSDTKAFLYHKNTLLKSFKLPVDNNSSYLWKNVLTDIFSTYQNHSSKNLENNDQLKNLVLERIVNNIDDYSRIESNNSLENKLNYEVKNNVVYIKSDNFYKGYSNDIKNIIQNTTNAEGLILDFRNNRGGDFNEAIKVADLFLDNALITYCKEKDRTHYYTSKKGDIFNNKKIVILVNNKTASAAEIVTAALSEQSRAVVIGTRTYGKGAVQSVHHLKNSKMYITTALSYTPSGKMIDNAGITPEICTGMNNSCTISNTNNDSKDILMAINLIKNKLG